MLKPVLILSRWNAVKCLSQLTRFIVLKFHKTWSSLCLGSIFYISPVSTGIIHGKINDNYNKHTAQFLVPLQQCLHLLAQRSQEQDQIVIFLQAV